MRRAVLRTSAAIGLLTVVDRLLGAVRQVLLAALFGAGASMDALVVGLSVSDLLLALVTGPFLSVFIPLHSTWTAREGRQRADRRGVNLGLWLVVVLGGAAALMALWGGRLAAWIGYGFAPGQREVAASLMPVLAVFLWLSGVGALLVGFYHVRGRFLTPQAAQIADRLTGVLVLLAVGRTLGIASCPLALAAGAAVALGLMLAGAARGVRRPWPEPSPLAPEVGGYLSLALPLLAGAVVDQAVLFTDRAMATTLTTGSVSALFYASALWGLPVALIGTNFCAVLFPRLSAAVASGDARQLHDSVRFGMRTMVVLMLGATALTLALARDATALLFERGQFTAASTDLTARALAALSLCLVFQGAGNVANIVLYAAQRTHTVAMTGLLRVVANALLNALLMGPLGAVGIALSTSLTLAAWTAVICVPLRRELARRGAGPIVDGAFRSLLLKALLAASAATAVAMAVTALPALSGADVASRAIRLLAGATAGLGIYAAGLRILRLPEAGEATRLLSSSRRLGGTA